MFGREQEEGGCRGRNRHPAGGVITKMGEVFVPLVTSQRAIFHVCVISINLSIYVYIKYMTYIYFYIQNYLYAFPASLSFMAITKITCIAVLLGKFFVDRN